MNLRFINILVLLIFPVFVYSQPNFCKAVIINDSGDSIRGYVKNYGWMENPEKFIFLNSSDTLEKKVYDASNARRVVLEGIDVYQKYTLPVSMDEVRYTMLSTRPDTTRAIKTVFLKILVEGCNANLYSYTDALKTRYFFTDQNITSPRELRYRTYFSDDHLKVITDKSYIKQLEFLANSYAPNNGGLNNRIKNAPYERNELIKIFSLINGGNNSLVCSIKVSDNKTKFRFFAEGGYRRSALIGMDHNDCHKLTSACHKTPSASFFLGAGLNILPDPASKVFFRESLSYSSDKLLSDEVFTEPTNYLTESYKYQFSQTNFTLGNMFAYKLLNGRKLGMYLGLGINFNYSKISGSQYYVYVQELYSSHSETVEPILDPSRIWMSFPVKLGIVLNDRIELNTSYYLPIGQNNDTTLEIWELGMSFNFNK